MYATPKQYFQKEIEKAYTVIRNGRGFVYACQDKLYRQVKKEGKCTIYEVLHGALRPVCLKTAEDHRESKEIQGSPMKLTFLLRGRNRQ